MWIPVPSNPQPSLRQEPDPAPGDGNGAILSEGAVVSERPHGELQRLRPDKPASRNIIDHQMSKVSLSLHRAERSEFGRGEYHALFDIGLWNLNLCFATRLRCNRDVQCLAVGKLLPSRYVSWSLSFLPNFPHLEAAGGSAHDKRIRNRVVAGAQPNGLDFGVVQCSLQSALAPMPRQSMPPKRSDRTDRAIGVDPDNAGSD